jgi:hypothetical protein
LDKTSTPTATAFAYALTRLEADMVGGQLDQVSAEADAKTRWAMLEGTLPKRFSRNRENKAASISIGNTTIVTPQVAFNTLRNHALTMDDGVIDVTDD